MYAYIHTYAFYLRMISSDKKRNISHLLFSLREACAEGVSSVAGVTHRLGLVVVGHVDLLLKFAFVGKAHLGKGRTGYH